MSVKTALAAGQGRAVWGFVGWIALCFGAAAIGAAFPPGAWYEQLAKPAWTPPKWVFGPVWTVLYLLMGIAAGLVWRRGGRATPVALALFLAQLALNALWSALFFGWRQPGLALIDLIALWALLLATVAAFWKVRPLAGALLLPYLVWTTFAGFLNYAIWQLNR